MQRRRRARCLRWSSIDRPCASAASTRHEATSRPSSSTEQAPQSPVAQPSFVPVRPRLSRSASSSVSLGSQRNSTGSPLIDRFDMQSSTRHRSLGTRQRQSPPRAWSARPTTVPSIRHRSRACRRWAVRRRSRRRRRAASAAASSADADQRVRRCRHEQRRRRNGTDAPRARPCTMPFASSVTLTPAPATAMSISVRGMKRR